MSLSKLSAVDFDNGFGPHLPPPALKIVMSLDSASFLHTRNEVMHVIEAVLSQKFFTGI
jgi:hypothetical protein